MLSRKTKGGRKETCSKCGGILDRKNQRYCKVCHADEMRLQRIKQKMNKLWPK